MAKSEWTEVQVGDGTVLVHNDNLDRFKEALAPEQAFDDVVSDDTVTETAVTTKDAKTATPKEA